MSYHDYVIKGGKFIGQFDEMYKACDDPWSQSSADGTTLSKSKNIAILNMKKYGIRSVLELGSGLGFYSNMIQEAGIRVKGLEISEAAVKRAQEKFPAIDFCVGGVSDLEKYSDFDAVIFAEVTWYILPQLAEAYQALLKAFRGKYFLHNLTFYKEGRQKFGTEYFTNFDQFEAHCPFKLLEYTVSQSTHPDSVISTSAIFQIDSK